MMKSIKCKCIPLLVITFSSIFTLLIFIFTLHKKENNYVTLIDFTYSNNYGCCSLKVDGTGNIVLLYGNNKNERIYLQRKLQQIEMDSLLKYAETLRSLKSNGTYDTSCYDCNMCCLIMRYEDKSIELFLVENYEYQGEAKFFIKHLIRLSEGLVKETNETNFDSRKIFFEAPPPPLN